MRRPSFTETEIREAVAQAQTLTDALRRLGLRTAGGNHRTLRRYIERFGISTAHFDPNAVRRAAFRHEATPLDEVLVTGSAYNRGRLKRRLYEGGLEEPICELCGQDEHWRGRRMALVLDHVNGDPLDNRLQNLRIVCPNCNATLDTHCGKKNRRDRARRPCLRCGAIFAPASDRQRYCSRECGQRSRAGTRGPQPHRRRVERPSYEQLLAEIARLGWSATGRRYGVSGNAIRKWVRGYEAERGGGA